MLPDSPRRFPTRDRMLLTAFRSPGRPPLSRCHYRVKAPDLPVRFWTCRFPYSFGLSAPPPKPVCPGFRRLPCLRPVAESPTGSNRVSTSPHSPLGYFSPLDRSVQSDSVPGGSLSGCARSPFAPRSRCFLRVSAMDQRSSPLRFRKLAVPQTSWNLLHYALRA